MVKDIEKKKGMASTMSEWFFQLGSRIASTTRVGRSSHCGGGRGCPNLRAFTLALQKEHTEGSSAPQPSSRSRTTGHHCSYRQIHHADYPGPLPCFWNHLSSSSSSSLSSDDKEEEEDLDLEIACQLSHTNFECQYAQHRQGKADLEAAVLLSKVSADTSECVCGQRPNNPQNSFWPTD